MNKLGLVLLYVLGFVFLIGIILAIIFMPKELLALIFIFGK